MATLKNHPGYWLRDDAAAAFDAFEDKYGVHQVNSAGRTKAQQQDLINRWNRGGAANRPPYLYQPASPASASPHVANGGIAVDLAAAGSVRDKLAEFGFVWFGSGDPVHYNFRGWSGASAPRPNQITKDRQDWLNRSRNAGLAVDGLEGPKTKAAYKAYQQFLGVKADGIWGPNTQAAHQRYYDSRQAPAQRPSSKSAGEVNFADIQSALNRHGYRLAVDGIWGPKSSAALADFQARNGLKVDRIVGALTWDKLNR